MSWHSPGHFTTVHCAVAAGLLYSISSAALPGIAQAASFGKTVITSAQNEPLSATVPVTDINTADFSVKLATEEMYQQLGLQPTDSMTVSFSPLSPTSGNIIIQTSQPLIMPFTDVVMALNDGGQQTVMPKTLLLPLNNNALDNIAETRVEILAADNKANAYDNLNARPNNSFMETATDLRPKTSNQMTAQTNTKLAPKNESSVNQLTKNTLFATATVDESAANYNDSTMIAVSDNSDVTRSSATQALVVKQGLPPPLSQAATVVTPQSHIPKMNNIKSNSIATSENALLASAKPVSIKPEPTDSQLTVKNAISAIKNQPKTPSQLTAEQASPIEAKNHALDTLTVQVTRRVLMVNHKTTLDAASHALLLADIAKKTTMSLFAAQAIGINKIKMLTTDEVAEQKTPEIISNSSRFDNLQNSMNYTDKENLTSSLPRAIESFKQPNLENTKTQGYSQHPFFHQVGQTRLPFMMQLDFPIITSHALKNQNSMVSIEQEPKVYLTVTNQYLAKDASLYKNHYHTPNSLNRTRTLNYK